MSSVIDVPVVIIGGGGCGLNLSIFLSDLNVEHVLFERHPGTAILPKAHYLNQRSMEIFRQHNFSEDITAAGCPIEKMCQIEWRTSFGGDAPYDGRRIARVPAFGSWPGHPAYEIYRRDSPILSSNIPLLRLEPIFRKVAEKRNPGGVHFSHTVTDIDDKGDCVLLTVKDADGKEIRYRAQYVVAADGGKFAGPKLGIKLEGPTNLVDFVSTHFKADLSKYWDDRTLITHFINPEGETMTNFDCGALVQMGPTWGRHSEEWTLHFGFQMDDKERYDEAKLVPKIRDLLKLPDLEIEVLHYSHWILDRVVADKYRVGRVFIAGDAAHRRPPTTGLGLNTAIEDALNISWKLASVLHGKGDPQLLDSYEFERRPVGLRNSDWGLFAFKHFNVLNAAVGLQPGNKKANIDHLTRVFKDDFYGAMYRAQIQKAVDLQDIEFSAHGIELGFHYEEGAIVPDGTEPPFDDPRGQIYTRSTRPGHRLPHAWLERNGRKLSTHDLVGRGEFDFVLITDEFGDDWTQAAKDVAKSTQLNIKSVAIKTVQWSAGVDLYEDHDDQWIELREIKNGGAILVRPDNFVAWRSKRPSTRGGKELLEAVNQILGQRWASLNSSSHAKVNGYHDAE